jgi:hypothetical protein
MECRKFFLGVAATLALAVGPAHAEDKPVWERSPGDQYRAMKNGGLFAASLALDQYGDRLHEYGRWGAVSQCFQFVDGTRDAERAVIWALCGDDLNAIDPSKLESELDKYDFSIVLKKSEEWKKVGADLQAKAKTEAGLVHILKQTEAASRKGGLEGIRVKEPRRVGPLQEAQRRYPCWEGQEPLRRVLSRDGAGFHEAREVDQVPV